MHRLKFLLILLNTWRLIHVLALTTFLVPAIVSEAIAQNNNVLKDLLNPDKGIIQVDPNNNQIIINPVKCNPPFVKVQNLCVCPAGTKKVGNNCLPVQVKIICQGPFVPNANQTKCICPAGTKQIGNNCIPVQVQILCQPPFVPNAKKTKCVCPAGLQKAGNKCIPVVNNPKCQWPFVYSKARKTCVCAKGYILNASGSKCLRAPKPASIPRSVVAEIQLCLNKLGYDAGPADGVSGRRTRNAWSSFRIDEGLRNRPSALSDEVTQDRLFQACARLDEAEAEIPEPQEPQPDDPEITSTEATRFTNFDPQNGYPEIQCASQAVAILLQGLLGEENPIGICGDVCVPIPQGMTPEQVEATSQSVKWCRNCTMIGENGMLCSADPDTTDTESEPN